MPRKQSFRCLLDLQAYIGIETVAAKVTASSQYLRLTVIPAEGPSRCVGHRSSHSAHDHVCQILPDLDESIIHNMDVHFAIQQNIAGAWGLLEADDPRVSTAKDVRSAEHDHIFVSTYRATFACLQPSAVPVSESWQSGDHDTMERDRLQRGSRYSSPFTMSDRAPLLYTAGAGVLQSGDVSSS